MILSLPSWSSIHSTHYLDSCIEVFSDELETAQEERSPPAITVLAYLRGCALLARGYLLDGLRDLYLIENRYLFPHEFIQTTVVPLLTEAMLLNLFLHESFYIESASWKKVQTRLTSRHMSIIDLENSGNSLDETTPVKSTADEVDNGDWSVLENNLTFDQFRNYVHRLSIVLDKETTEILFNALLRWTSQSTAKTNPKPADAPRTGRRGTITAIGLQDTFTMLNAQRRGSGSSSTQEGKPDLPATLFESFLDIWQQTNADKVRMNRCLPEERKKQESILKVRSATKVDLSSTSSPL